MDEELKAKLDDQNWGLIIKRLTLHAHLRLKFWKLVRDKGLKGYSAEDIALEAVSLAYSGEWKWDPKKSDLLTYLKFHVVNGLVSNLARNKEVLNSVNSDEFDSEDTFSVEDDLNASLITNLIRNSLKDDELLLKLYDGLFSGMKREELSKHLQITIREFDNSLRRLKSRMLKFKKLSLQR